MPKDVVCPRDNEAFVKLIIEILTRIRSADKPKWHHRMTYRVRFYTQAVRLTANLYQLARIHLDEWDDVTAAYNELKTMFANKNTLLAIWKPPNERYAYSLLVLNLDAHVVYL